MSFYTTNDLNNGKFNLILMSTLDHDLTLVVIEISLKIVMNILWVFLSNIYSRLLYSKDFSR